MKFKFLLLCVTLFITGICDAQYEFETILRSDCTGVKNQNKTGTCWSFATCSFLESELIRNKVGNLDLSEMFVVKNIYKDKAHNYMMRQGKANFSEGALAHDFINTVARHGIVPEEVFSGKEKPEAIHDHSEMEAALKGMLDGLLKRKRLSPKWKVAFDAVLDTYIGEYPTEFTYEGKKYTPQSYAMSLGLKPDNYVNLASYTHRPFYSKFILEIPDNWSNGAFYNIPLADMTAIIDYALDQGYTIAWDGDVSEKGFSAREGIAILPADPSREDLFTEPGEEIQVSQELRQETFESYATTDDHLMHLVGKAKDKKGNIYYIIKNSWGEISDFKGYLYMSKEYLKLKTVAISVHKSAIPKGISTKLFL